MNEWQPIATAPEGVLVDTKIADENGERNVQHMMRRGHLWWIYVGHPSEMYVYYRPTHWRPLIPAMGCAIPGWDLCLEEPRERDPRPA